MACYPNDDQGWSFSNSSHSQSPVEPDMVACRKYSAPASLSFLQMDFDNSENDQVVVDKVHKLEFDSQKEVGNPIHSFVGEFRRFAFVRVPDGWLFVSSNPFENNVTRSKVYREKSFAV